MDGAKVGSAEFSRLLGDSQKLSAVLHDAKLAREVTPPHDYDDATEDELIQRLESLLQYARDTKALGEHVAHALATDAERNRNDGRVLLEPGDAGYEEQQALLTAPKPADAEPEK
jgi:hypothetical protein